MWVHVTNMMYEEANDRECQFSWIGADSKGNWIMYCTTEEMPCGAMSLDSENVIIG